jgi:ornithine cyclodeaminase
MLILADAAVRRLFPMSAAIEVARDVLRRYSTGTLTQPLRTMMHTPRGQVLAVMPADVPADGPTPGGLGLKAITLAPGNPALGLPAHLGMVLLFDPDTGRPDALIDGTALTAIRTPAVSAVATAALALPHAATLGVLGAGVQARGHIEAIALVRELRAIRVWSRDPEHARALAQWAAQKLGVRVEATGSPAAAVADADLICTTTTSDQPLLQARDISAGAHINAIGAAFPTARELCTDLVQRCAVFVDSREAALAEAGDLLLAYPEPATAARHIRAEIGEVLLGRHGGRTDEHEVTLFKSVGLAVEDILCAAHIVALARDSHEGVEVDM